MFALLTELIGINTKDYLCVNDHLLLAVIYSQQVKNRNFSISVTNDYQSIIFQGLKVEGLLGEKFHSFIPTGIQIELDFPTTKATIKLHSFRALKCY